MEITVIVCTFRRPQVVETLSSLMEQQGLEHIWLRYLVIDNDVTPSAEAVVRDFFSSRGIDRFDYVHAPAQNISIARNAGLDHCQTTWAIMIDDDEIADPSLVLNILSSCRDDTRVVFGRSRAVYPSDAPGWMLRAELHSNEIGQGPGSIDRGYTSIALVDVDWVNRQGIRFDERLGTVGGEDVFFFHEIHRAGGFMQYEAQAIVYEPVPRQRLALGWYARRRWRSGQVKALLKHRFATGSGYLAFCARCLAVAGLSFPVALIAAPLRRGLAAKWFGRGVENIGALAHAAGVPLYREYA